MSANLPFVIAMVLDRGAYALILVLLAQAVGLGEQSDVFFAVTSIPMVLSTVLTDAAAVIILRQSGGGVGADHRVARSLILIFAALGLLLAALAGPLIQLAAPGLGGQAHIQAVHLSHISALLLPLHGIGTISATRLIARRRVWLGAMRLPLTNGLAVGGILVGLSLGWDDASLFVLSMVAGAAIWLGALWWTAPGADHADVQPIAISGWSVAMLTARSLVLLAGTNMAANAIILLERSLASIQGAGVMSGISLARSMVVLLGAVSASAATGWFTLSMAAAKGAADDRSNALRTGRMMLETSLLVLIPVMALFLCRSHDIISVLFERGRFSAQASAQIHALALPMAAAAPLFVIGVALFRTMQMCRQDRAVLIHQWVGFGLYAVLAVGLTMDTAGGQGGRGLVAAYVVALLMLVVIQGWHLGRVLDWSLYALPLGRVLRVGAAVGGGLTIRYLIDPRLDDAILRLGLDGGIVLAGFALGCYRRRRPV